MLVNRYIRGRVYNLHYRQTTNILQLHADVNSPHLAFVVCIPTVIKTLLHGFDPHITLYLRCEYFMFLGAFTHCIAISLPL